MFGTIFILALNPLCFREIQFGGYCNKKKVKVINDGALIRIIKEIGVIKFQYFLKKAPKRYPDRLDLSVKGKNHMTQAFGLFNSRNLSFCELHQDVGGKLKETFRSLFWHVKPGMQFNSQWFNTLGRSTVFCV